MNISIMGGYSINKDRVNYSRVFEETGDRLMQGKPWTLKIVFDSQTIFFDYETEREAKEAESNFWRLPGELDSR